MTPITPSYSVRDLQRNYRAVVDEAKKRHDAVLLINNNQSEIFEFYIFLYNRMRANQ